MTSLDGSELELTEDEYSEKFSRPNYKRLHSRTRDNNHTRFSNDNPSFVRDEDPEELSAPSEKNISEIPNPVSPRKDINKLTVSFSNESPSFARDEHLKEYRNQSKESLDEMPNSAFPPKDDTAMAKPSRRCLWIIIAILSILLVTMTALFIWRMACCQNKETIKTVLQKEPTKAPVQVHCVSLPSPVNFPTLPASIQKELQEFNTFLSEAVDKNQTVAVSTNVVYRDKVIMKGAFGKMNKAEKSPRSPTVNTIYPCASISKILTALMFFKQVSDTKVRSLVDATVAQYDVKFDVKNPFNDDKITFWQLATQTSGLQREAPCYPSTATNLCPHDYNTMMDRLKNLTLVQRPGKLAQYSNFGFAVLGQVLFKKFATTEATFGQWMKNGLLSKLGMTGATFSFNEIQKSNVPIGYLSDMTSYPVQSWGWLDPAGGMFASVDDLSKLQIELMSDKSSGRIISPQLIQEFFKPSYVFPGGTMIGSPWLITRTEKGYLLREKNGFIYGYNSYIVMVPELRLGLNLQCTGCNGKLSNAGRTRFLRILDIFDKELRKSSIKKFTMPPNPKFFIGRYNSSIPVISFMEVKQKKGENNFLVLAVNGAEIFFLNYVSGMTFRIVINQQVDCATKFTLGVENGVVIFDESSIPGGLAPRFVMFGAEPSGRSYFYRQ